MLPINLLPNYIFDKNKKLKAWVVCFAAIAAVAIFFVVWSNNVQKTVDEAKTELTDATDKRSKYDAKVSEIGKVKAQIADTENKQNFIASAQKYNAAWPEAFSLIRDLTDKNVLLKNMAFTGTDHKTIRVSAFAVTEETIANWWMKLRTRTDIFENINMQYPGRPYHPGAATAAGSMPGSGGMGMPMGGGAMRPSMMSMGGSGGGMPSSGGMGMPGSGGMGLPGSGGGAAGGDAVGPTTIEDRPGINFIATMVLKVPLDNGAAVPIWTGAAAAPAAAAPKRASTGSAGGKKDNGD